MKSPLSILSPMWSGFFNLGDVGVALGISLGGSGAAATPVDRVRFASLANGFPVEKEGERLVLSRKASDQLNPSATWSQ